MFELLRTKNQAIKRFLHIQQFQGDKELAYEQFRYEQASPILRLAFLIGGIITLILTLGEFIFDGALSYARLTYLIVWMGVYFKSWSTRKGMINAYCVYFCISVVFFTYQYYFVLQREEFLVPIINLMATAIIVSKIGVRISGFIALFIPATAAFMFAIGGEANQDTSQLVFLLCLTAVVVWFSSIILEKSSRSKFAVLEDLKTSQQNEFRAGQARMEFLAFMSHEIRTPLTAIIGYAESIIEDDIDSKEQTEFVARIKSNGDHLLHIVNDILDLSKIEQGKFSLYEEPVSLFELLRDVRFATENLAAKKSLDFKLEFDSPLPQTIQVDRGRLIQILVNLIGNGIKFTDAGHVCLRVSAHQDMLCFSVTDTGIGIGEEAQQRLFQSFEQVHAQGSRQYGGTGLGLTISKRLAVLMGGELTFSSELGKGSQFDVTIACGDIADSKWIHAADEFVTQDTLTTSNDQFTGRILVADDVQDNRNILALLLKKMAVDVDFVSNGKIAVEAALVTDYDVILMDIQMPVMDGLQALKQLRDLGNQTPVIATTANVMDRDIQQYLSIGFNGHLGKPIDRQALNDILRKFLPLEGETQLLDANIDGELEQLRQRYLVKLKQQTDSLLANAATQSWQAMAKSAHAIKGTASSFGLSQISELADKLEQAATLQEDNAIALTNQLVHEIEQTSC